MALGVSARLALIHSRSLWLDEIYTLTTARLSLGAMIDALHVETNAPLHYVVAHLLLVPLGSAPHRLDFLLRYASLAAALLHFPLLRRIAGRLGAPAASARAAALFALAPVAIVHDSEIRAYSLGSLLVLAALERALALRESPRLGNAALLSLWSALAVWTHLNSLFPLVGLAFLFRRGGRPAALFAAAGAAAALLAAPWLWVTQRQPEGALAWARLIPLPQAAARVFVNMVLGVDQDAAPWLGLLLAAGVVLVAAFGLAARRAGAARELAGVVAVGALGVALLAVAKPFTLGPSRTAVAFVPLTALLIALVGRTATLASGAVSLACLAQQAPGWAAATPVDRLAASLVPMASAGWSVCAVGIYGPELDYKLRRAEPRAEVLFFPSDMNRHRGWHDDRQPATDVLRAEAASMVARSGPRLFVLPFGSRASAALGAELARHDALSWGKSAYVEVVALRP